MSLDVYLHQPGSVQTPLPTIYIREAGATRAVTRDEWDRRFPGREPFLYHDPAPTDVVFHANITHNLACMARQAGLYGVCWEPETCGLTTAAQLAGPLAIGYTVLRQDPRTAARWAPVNGWGTYEGLLQFVADYLAACVQWPEATITVSR